MLSTPSFADEEAMSVLRRVVQQWNASRSFRAKIIISSGPNAIEGSLSYQNGRIYLGLSDGRVISSNGSQMIVYDPATHVAGQQDMKTDGPLAGGLKWLLSPVYEARLSGNSVRLKAEKPTAGIQEVNISYNEQFLLRKLSYRKDANGDWVTISIENIQTVEGFPSNLFSFQPPAGSRTVTNPLNQSN